MLNWSQQNFAHITTALLLWDVQKLIVIGWICNEKAHCKVSLNFEFDQNIISGTRAWFKKITAMLSTSHFISVPIIKCKCTKFGPEAKQPGAKITYGVITSNTFHAYPRLNAYAAGFSSYEGFLQTLLWVVVVVVVCVCRICLNWASQFEIMSDHLGGTSIRYYNIDSSSLWDASKQVVRSLYSSPVWWVQCH